MRGLKFFVAWEALFSLILLKFAFLAAWVATINEYKSGFWFYFQAWFAVGLSMANAVLIVLCVICSVEGAAPWKSKIQGSYYYERTYENRPGWF